MRVIEKLSSATGKRNKIANKALAKDIAAQQDSASITSLTELLNHPDRNIQSDAIEVLYESGYLNPDLIAGHVYSFVTLLNNKNNRLVWGAMIALSSISKTDPRTIYKFLPQIVTAMAKGSVITKDAGVALFANLAAVASQKPKAVALLLKELAVCPPKQLPQYAEKSIIAVDEKNKHEFIELFETRMADLEKESQIKRLKKILRML
jgi:HEAT repeat protein